MEERLARLETSVEHVQTEVSELRQDLRDFRSETHGRFLSLENKFLWVMAAIGASFATLLGFMARGFGWI